VITNKLVSESVKNAVVFNSSILVCGDVKIVLKVRPTIMVERAAKQSKHVKKNNSATKEEKTIAIIAELAQVVSERSSIHLVVPDHAVQMKELLPQMENKQLKETMFIMVFSQSEHANAHWEWLTKKALALAHMLSRKVKSKCSST
jgi:hypothetical protein